MSGIAVVAETTYQEPWLRYTLDLVGRLAGLEKPIKLAAPDQVPEDCCCVHYGDSPGSSSEPFIPHRPKWRSGFMTTVAADCGPGGPTSILVYEDTRASASGALELEYDLFFNFFALVSCLEEYEHERAHGPVHSYALRLKGDARRFDEPHANYLAMAFAALLRKAFPDLTLAETPPPRLFLSHDVDLLEKKAVTRLKEGAFRAFNTGKNLLTGRWSRVPAAARDTLRLIFSREDYFLLSEVAELESRRDFRSAFNIFAGHRPATIGGRILGLIFDPPYDIDSDSRLIPALRQLAADGFEIGVHLAFETWRGADEMRRQREALERALGDQAVKSCRQHWFRFSLAETWRDQYLAGIAVDSTLGFTDRPGFRSGLAAAYQPYDHETGKAHPITVIPTILMDTHLYYYGNMAADERRALIRRLIGHIATVGGQASVIWHTHVFSKDHGWDDDYAALLTVMNEQGIRAALPREAVVQPGAGQ